MNSKEKMYKLLKGESTDILPVCPHWWGQYKYWLKEGEEYFNKEFECWDSYG